MNMLKKWLCFVLAFAIISIPVCYANETTTDISTVSDENASDVPGDFSDIDYSSTLGTAVDTLVEKSIITGFPDGTFKAEQTLTRAEFAKIIVCFLGSSTDINQDSGFPDVDNVGGSAHWAKPYIKIAKDMNIITGFPDGTFMPDAPVTYEQSVKMIMCALGFTNLSYPDGYIQLAMQKKLFVNSPHTGGQSAAITRGTTGIFIYNALSITPNNKTTDNTNATFTGGSFGGSGGGSSSGGGGGGGGGSSSKNSRKVTGIVWGTETTMLDTTQSILYSDEISLRYQDKEGNHIEEVLRVASKYQKNIDFYLGKQIRAVVQDDDDGKEYISEITVIENKNTLYKNIGIGKIIEYGTDAKTGTPTIKYEDSNEDERTLTLNSPENVYIILNGKSVCTETPDKYEFNLSYLKDVKMGSFEMLSNDGDKKPDIIFITSYKTVVVNGKLASSGTIKLKYGEDDLNVLYIDPEKGATRAVSSFKNSSSNTTVELYNLKEYDIIDYRETVDKDFFYGTLSAAADTAVTGTFIKMDAESLQIRNNSTGKKETYDINYNYLEYLESYSGTDKFVPEENDTVRLYFNSRNKVSAIEEIISLTESKYGYIVETAYKDADKGSGDDYLSPTETPDENDSVALSLYQIDSSKSTIGSFTSTPLLVDSTVRVDGKIYKNKPEDVMAILKKAATLSNEGKSSELNRNTTYSSFIRYEMSGNRIITIDTILDSTGEALSTESDSRFNTLFRSPEFVYDDSEGQSGKHKYYSSSSSPGFYKASQSYTTRVKLYNNSSKSTHIFIPGNRGDKKSYSASKFVYTNFNSGMEYYIEAYNVSGGYAEFLFQFISDEKDVVSAYSTMAIITDVDVYDEDDPDALILKYRTPSTTSDSTIKLHPDSPAEEKYDNLNVGDVILFSTALDKRMYDFFHSLSVVNLPVKRIDSTSLIQCAPGIYDRRINGFSVYPTDDQNTKPNAKYRTIYGTAIDVSTNGTATLSINPILVTDYFEEFKDELTEELIFNSSTKLFIYDESKNSVTAVSPVLSKIEDNLFVAAQYGYKDADQVFIYTTASSSTSEPTIKFIYIIRSKDQEKPANYPGVETPETDPYEDERATAKETLEEYIEAIDKTEYSLKQELFEGILTNGKKAISEAENEEDIEAALTEAMANADNVPSDADFDDAKTTTESYVDIILYEDAEPLVTEALQTLESPDSIDTKTALSEFLQTLFDQIDEAVLTLVAADKIAEVDEYVDEIASTNGYDFTEDTDLNAIIEDQKEIIGNASTIGELDSLLSDAKAAIDDYVSENYPKESSDPEGDPEGAPEGDPEE